VEYIKKDNGGKKVMTRGRRSKNKGWAGNNFL
jgi:hypothetical protein